jgi:hypothetical protein
MHPLLLVPTLLSTIFALVLTTGCKISINTPSGGGVESLSKAYSCGSSRTCVIDVYDIHFDEIFVAKPNHGFEFLTWHRTQKGLCGLQQRPCKLSTAEMRSHPLLLQILESDEVYKLQPIFIKYGQTGFWQDEINNFEDAWGAEARWKDSKVLDPHKWQKAFRIPSSLLQTDQYAYLYEFTWWGYYKSGLFEGDPEGQLFEIIFYADKNGIPADVIARRRLKVKVSPVTDYTGQRTIRSLLPEYNELPVYEFNKKLGRPIHLPRGDVWISVIQLDEQGRMDPDFIWHGKVSSRISPVAFLTDYGGWIQSNYLAGISGRINIKGVAEGWY